MAAGATTLQGVRLALAVLAVAASFAFVSVDEASAHQNGCHRWHSCPSDTGSYVCGDLGYNTYCPGASTTPPPAPEKNCVDFASQQEAQSFYESVGGPTLDPHYLDADFDRIACEENPCPCSYAQPPPPPPPPVIPPPAVTNEPTPECLDAEEDVARLGHAVRRLRGKVARARNARAKRRYRRLLAARRLDLSDARVDVVLEC